MALEFNGTNSLVQFFNSGGISGITGFPISILVWAKPAAAQATYAGYAGGVGTTGGGGLEVAFSGNEAGDNVYASPREGGTAGYDTGTGPFATGSWQAVLCVWTSATSRKVYLTGRTADTGTDSWPVTMTSFQRIVLGLRPSADDSRFTGALARFAIWTTALDDADWAALDGGALPSAVKSGSLLDYLELNTLASSYVSAGSSGRTFTASNVTLASDHPPGGGDTTPPTLTSPTGTGGLGVCSGSVSTNEGNGTLFAVATASTTQPSIAQIKAGQDHTGAAALRAVSQSVTATGTQTIASGAITGGAGTRYWHFVHTDAAANDSARVSSAGFSVTAAATSITIALKQSDGTTAAASITAIHWKLLNTATLGAATSILAGGTAESTDASGNLVLDITGLGLSPGDVRYVVAGKSNGTPGADFDGWQGPATAA